ncbi:hypothetical protein ACOI1C_19805 [Bacillus sp. DJP31]|uniref:hypothetical protein n=1 Tax=Bacillus sp. DJP31 TaxID=3409789 RepID=UPI003BB6C073
MFDIIVTILNVLFLVLIFYGLIEKREAPRREKVTYYFLLFLLLFSLKMFGN